MRARRTLGNRAAPVATLRPRSGSRVTLSMAIDQEYAEHVLHGAGVPSTRRGFRSTARSRIAESGASVEVAEACLASETMQWARHGCSAGRSRHQEAHDEVPHPSSSEGPARPPRAVTGATLQGVRLSDETGAPGNSRANGHQECPP